MQSRVCCHDERLLTAVAYDEAEKQAAALLFQKLLFQWLQASEQADRIERCRIEIQQQNTEQADHIEQCRIERLQQNAGYTLEEQQEKDIEQETSHNDHSCKLRNKHTHCEIEPHTDHELQQENTALE